MSKNTTAPVVTASVLDTLAANLPASEANTVRRYNEQKANGVVNPIVLAALLGVRPQMIYNYIRKGKFSESEAAFGENSTQKKVIYLDEANTFAQGYTDRKVARETKAAEKVAEELAGDSVEETETVDA
jgi:hypothetical protein